MPAAETGPPAHSNELVLDRRSQGRIGPLIIGVMAVNDETGDAVRLGVTSLDADERTHVTLTVGESVIVFGQRLALTRVDLNSVQCVWLTVSPESGDGAP